MYAPAVVITITLCILLIVIYKKKGKHELFYEFLSVPVTQSKTTIYPVSGSNVVISNAFDMWEDRHASAETRKNLLWINPDETVFYGFVCLAPITSAKVSHIAHIMNNKSASPRIVCIGDASARMFHTLCKIMKWDVPEAMKILDDKEGLDALDEVGALDNVDAVFTFVLNHSRLAASTTSRLAPVSYMPVNNDVLKHICPISSTRYMDVTVLFPKIKHSQPLYSCITFDQAAYIKRAYRYSNEAHTWMNQALGTTELMILKGWTAKMQYHLRYLPTYPEVKQIVSKLAKTSVVNEYFTDEEKPILMTLSTVADLQRVRLIKHQIGDYKVIIVDRPQVNGISLKKGDKLIISNHANPEVNDTYIVNEIMYNHFKNVQGYKAENAYPLSLEDMQYKLLSIHPKGLQKTILLQDVSVPTSYSKVYLQDEGLHGVIVDRSSTSVSVSVYQSKYDEIDKYSRCISDPSQLTKAACESDLDELGILKTRGVWDAPCSSSVDCPFYRVGEEYTTPRGGCNDNGYCEMPVGVNRIGYTKYMLNESSHPVCYNCPFEEQPECCQKDGESPVFAFALDDPLEPNLLIKYGRLQPT
jgi:hypothetical protein